MNAKRFHEWLKLHTDNLGIRQLAAKVDTTHTTLGRQLSGESALDPNLVVKLARAFDLNVLEALVAADVITDAEAGAPSTNIALAKATDVDLAREILNRAENSEAMGWPVSEAASGRKHRTHDNADAFDAPADVEDDFVEDTRPAHIRAVEDLDSLPYVAGTDDSEDELDRD